MFARDSIKRSYKLDFNFYHASAGFFGLVQLNLNNNAMDPTQMREAVAFSLFRDAGLPAPRTAFARIYLTVPGQHERAYAGLYTIVEEVDGRFLQRNYGTRKGLMLRPKRVIGLPWLGPFWAAYSERMGPRNYADADDVRRFLALVEMVNQAEVSRFREEIDSFIEMDAFLRFLALETILANMDSPLGTGENFFMYLHPLNRRLVFMPWDLNEAFGGFLGVNSSQLIQLNVHRPFVKGNNFLDRLWALGEIRAGFRQQVKSLLAGPCSEEKIFARMEQIRSAIRPSLVEDKSVALDLFDLNFRDGPVTQTVKEEIEPPEPPPGDSGEPPGSGPSGAGAPAPPNLQSVLAVKPLLKPFITSRWAFMREQLAGRLDGFTPDFANFAPPPELTLNPGNQIGPALFQWADTNQDQRLTEGEWMQAMECFFTDCDVQGKGVVGLVDLTDGIRNFLPPPPDFSGMSPGGGPPAKGGPAPAAGQSQAPQRPDFRPLSPAIPRSKGATNSPAPPRRGGQVAFDEKDPNARPTDPPMIFAGQWLRTADTNRDRRATREEWLAAGRKFFKSWDRNQDHLLDSAEVCEGLNQLLRPMPPPGSGRMGR